jgi:hypothetical protein
MLGDFVAEATPSCLSRHDAWKMEEHMGGREAVKEKAKEVWKSSNPL